MNKREVSSLVAAVAVGAVVALIPVSSAAQGVDKAGKAAPTGPTPRMPDGKPDLQGVWTPGLSFANMGQVSLQPWAQELYQQRRATLSKDDPEGHCLPAGVPRISPFPQKF